MLKSTTTSFILFLILLLAASQAFAGIAVLERLKTESVIFRATGEGVYPEDSSMSSAQKKLMAKRAATVDGRCQASCRLNTKKISLYPQEFLMPSDELLIAHSRA